jgi:dolichyl-phosphate beta-glucosyltransferase
MLLSIVIPAFNEEKRILATLEKITQFLNVKGYHYEIIVVDDGSTDNTVNVVRRFSEANRIPVQILESSINCGKGCAVRRGILSSNGDYVLFTDADLSTPIEEIEKFLPLLRQGYDVVIGSRALRDSQLLVRQPWYRERMGKTFNFFVQIFVMRGIIDTQCGFKVFKLEVAKRIFSLVKIDRFAFDAEAIFIAKKIGYRLKDVPVIWLNSPSSKVHIIKDSFRMFTDLLRIQFNNLRGMYGK